MRLNFREIKADLLSRIVGGEFPPGSRLPAETELTVEYGVARTTVGRALRELADEGIVERRRKAGTHVRLAPLRQARFEIPVVRAEITDTGAAYRYALVSAAVLPAPDFLRARLGLPPGAEMRHLVCVHFSDGRPYQMEDRWIDLGAVPGARDADFTQIGPNEWLVRQIPYSQAEISFGAVNASEVQAQHLDCAPGDALVCIERQTRYDGRPLTYVRLVYARGHRLTTRY